MKKTFLQITLFVALFYGVFLLFHSNKEMKPIDHNRSDPSFHSLSTQGKTMGTTWSIRVFVDDPSWDQDHLNKRVQTKLDQIDRLMSTYKPDSELSRFNQWKSTEWFPISQDMAFVLERALEIAQKSEGAFDITVGPLVNLWKFGPDKSPLTELPSDEKIQEVRKKIGYQKLEIQKGDHPSLRKFHPDLYVDLSAIAKGYAVDQVAAVLKKENIHNFMVEVGGEIRCEGKKYPTSGQNESSFWILGIEEPRFSGSDQSIVLNRTVSLSGRSLATSGDYRNYRQIGQTRFSHLIDPRTGRPVELLSARETEENKRRLGSVSVILDSCMDADAWATAFFVLGPEKGLEIADQYDIPVLFLCRIGSSDQGKTAPVSSKSFSRFDQF